jgi:hypothetical protein
MLEAPNIRTDISPSVHPASLAGHSKVLDVEGTMGRHVLTDAHTAMTVVYQCMGEVKDVRASVELSHRTGREEVRQGRVALEIAYPDTFFSAVDRAYNRAARQVDSADAGIRAKITALETKVKTLTDDPSVNKPVAVEIRAHAKSLSDSARIKFISDAASAGDKATLASLLAAPAYLSGLTTEQASLARKLAQDKFAPVESAQLTAAHDVLERVRKAGSYLVGQYSEICSLRESAPSKTNKAIQKLGT